MPHLLIAGSYGMGFVLPDPINDSFPFGVDSNPFSPSVTLLLVKAPQLYELKCVDCYSRCFAKLLHSSNCSQDLLPFCIRVFLSIH